MPDKPACTDWLTIIEPEDVGKVASKYGNRYAEITEGKVEDLKAEKILCYVNEYGIFIKLNKE